MGRKAVYLVCAALVVALVLLLSTRDSTPKAKFVSSNKHTLAKPAKSGVQQMQQDNSIGKPDDLKDQLMTEQQEQVLQKQADKMENEASDGEQDSDDDEDYLLQANQQDAGSQLAKEAKAGSDKEAKAGSGKEAKAGSDKEANAASGKEAKADVSAAKVKPAEEAKPADEATSGMKSWSEAERKAEAMRVEKEKLRLFQEDARIRNLRRKQEEERQQLEKFKLELNHEKEWLETELERFEQYKRGSLRGNLTIDPVKPDDMEVVDAESARLKLQSLQRKDFHLWNGLDSVAVSQRYPGIILSGTYMLREFIDPDDPRALGMDGQPHGIEDMTESSAEERFYQLVTVEQMQCADKRRMGNFGDGGWDICVAGPYEPQDGCIVYSIGINNDFTFDDSIGEVYGCDVRAYDPSMKVGDHRRSDRVYFYKIGLGSEDTVNDKGWKLLTFAAMLDRNGHSHKIIDYLKIDIEHNEWTSFPVMLQQHSLRQVKQLAFEIHTSEMFGIGRPSNKEDFLHWYDTLLGLEKQGFRRYHYHFNPYGRYTSMRTGKERTCCYELYYLNINFLRPS